MTCDKPSWIQLHQRGRPIWIQYEAIIAFGGIDSPLLEFKGWCTLVGSKRDTLVDESVEDITERLRNSITDK